MPSGSNSSPDPSQLRAAAVLIKHLAKPTENRNNDGSKSIAAVERTAQQKALGIAPHLIYICGLVTILCPNSILEMPNNNHAKVLFNEFQKLFHDTQYRHALERQSHLQRKVPTPPKVTVYQWSRSLHPSAASLAKIQQEMADTVLELEQEAQLAALELLQAESADSQKEQMRPTATQAKKEEAPSPPPPLQPEAEQNSNASSSPTRSPQQVSQTLQQVLAAIHIDQRVDDDKNNPNDWIPVGGRRATTQAILSLVDTSHHNTVDDDETCTQGSSSYTGTFTNSVMSSRTGETGASSSTNYRATPPPPSRSRYASTLASAIPEASVATSTTATNLSGKSNNHRDEQSQSSSSRPSNSQQNPRNLDKRTQSPRDLPKHNPSVEVILDLDDNSAAASNPPVNYRHKPTTLEPLRHQRKPKPSRDLIEATRSLDTNNLRALASSDGTNLKAMASHDNNNTNGKYLRPIMSYDQGVRSMPSYDQPIQTVLTAPIQHAATMTKSSPPIRLKPKDNVSSLIEEHGIVKTVSTVDTIFKFSHPTTNNNNHSPHRVGTATQPIVIPEPSTDGPMSRPEVTVASLQNQVAALQAKLKHERQQHARELRREQALAEERVQELQLRLYISETRLQLYEDSLSQQIQTVANNVGARTSPRQKQQQQHPNKAAIMDTTATNSPLARVLSSSQEIASIEIVATNE